MLLSAAMKRDIAWFLKKMKEAENNSKDINNNIIMNTHASDTKSSTLYTLSLKILSTVLSG